MIIKRKRKTYSILSTGLNPAGSLKDKMKQKEQQILNNGGKSYLGGAIVM